MSLFPADFLTRIEYLSLVSRRVFRGSLLAQRRTMQTGGGIEFSDHREYTAGDDFRYLDWNVYARHGDLLLKRFQEEQDLHVYLLLDCSRSMGFGSPTKFDLARQLVAALAYIALGNLDRIAVIAFADNVAEEYPLVRGKAHILALMRFLERLSTTGEVTSLSRGIQGLLHRNSRRGLVVLISDLFDSDRFEPALDQLRFKHFDGHVIQLHATEEANPGLLGDVELVDVESQSARKVTVTERNLRLYKRLFNEHQEGVRQYCHAYGMGCAQSNSNMRFDDLILKMMRLAGQDR